MASFRKRNGLWQVQVRNRKIGSISKSFHIKSEAQKWAKEQEILMQSGGWSKTEKSHYSLEDLLTKYKNEITPTKRGHVVENRKLKRLLKEKKPYEDTFRKTPPPYSGYL